MEGGGRGSEADAVAVQAMALPVRPPARPASQHCQSPWHGQTEVIFPPCPDTSLLRHDAPPVLASDSNADEQHMQKRAER